MRNHILLLSTALLLAACADDQHPAAPTSSRSASNRTAAGDIRTSAQSVNPQAKPVDQVGFTTLTTVTGEAVTVAAGQSGGATALCPVGDRVTGGGFSTSGLGTSPYVGRSSFTQFGSQDAWIVLVQNTAPGAATFTLTVYAHCVH